MKKTLLFILLIALASSCGTRKNEIQKVYYVINVLGAELFENASLESKILKKIDVGEKVIPIEIINSEESKIIGDGLSLKGDFIKIQNGTKHGFLFSSDLSKIKPKMKDVYEGIFVVDLMGTIKSKKTVKRKEKIGDQEYEIEDEITEYENGKYIYTAFDGCFNHVYIFKNLSLSEVYHQLTADNFEIANYTTKNEIEIPVYKSKRENEFLFYESGATQDLKITVNEDGTYTVSSNDCV